MKPTFNALAARRCGCGTPAAPHPGLPIPSQRQGVESQFATRLLQLGEQRAAHGIRRRAVQLGFEIDLVDLEIGRTLPRAQTHDNGRTAATRPAHRPRPCPVRRASRAAAMTGRRG